MKINLDDKALISAALALVEESEYFDALCLFARVDNYESMLNQIGCLCALHDVGYATELYRKLLARYYFTHNCYADVVKLGEATEIMSSYNTFDKDKSTVDAGKISANVQLLGYYPTDYDGFDDYDDLESLTQALYSLKPSKKRVFLDVKTPEFYLNLCQRMERAYFDGNFTKGRELQRQFMSIDTDDTATLEMQLFLCLTQQQWERGVPYALKYVSLPDVTPRGMGVCVQILYRAGDEYKAVIEGLLTNLTQYGEDIADVAMMDYVQISASVIGYGETTLALAKILFSHYKDAGCTALSLCARIFFNCGDVSLARESILLLLRAVPWDGVASVYLTYFNKNIGVPLDGITTSNSLVRHFDVPTQLSVIAQYALLKDMEQNDLVLSCDSFDQIACMYKLCLGCIVKGDVDRFFAEAQTLSAILYNLVPQDKQAFFDFAKQCLCSMLSEPTINKDFLCKLIHLGYRDKLLVSHSRGYYALDLTHLHLTDNAFVHAFGICATLRKVDAKRLERAYMELKQTLGNNEFNDDADTARLLAYAMLAMSYKRFVESDESAYFADEEHSLYTQYLKLSTN